MPLHERAAARVLPGEPDRHALLEQRAEREQLAHGPVDAALADHRGTPLHQLLQLGVQGEALGHVHERVADVLHVLGRDGRVRTTCRRLLVGLLRGGTLQAPVALGVTGGQHVRAGVGGAAGAGGLLRLHEDPLELLLVVAQGCLSLLDRDVAAADADAQAEADVGLDDVGVDRLEDDVRLELAVANACVDRASGP